MVTDHPSPTPEGRRCPDSACHATLDDPPSAHDWECLYRLASRTTPAPEGGVLVIGDDSTARLAKAINACATPTPAATGEEEQPCNRCGVRGEPSVRLNGGYCNDCAVVPAGVRARLQELLASESELRLQLTKVEAQVGRYANRNESLRRQLAEAAGEIPSVAGPVASRIRVLREEWSRHITALEQRATTAERRLEGLLGVNANLAADNQTLEGQLTASQQEVARLTEAHQQRERVWAERFALLDQQNARLREALEKGDALLVLCVASLNDAVTSKDGIDGMAVRLIATEVREWQDGYRAVLSTPQQGEPG